MLLTLSNGVCTGSLSSHRPGGSWRPITTLFSGLDMYYVTHKIKWCLYWLPLLTGTRRPMKDLSLHYSRFRHGLCYSHDQMVSVLAPSPHRDQAAHRRPITTLFCGLDVYYVTHVTKWCLYWLPLLTGTWGLVKTYHHIILGFRCEHKVYEVGVVNND